MATNDAPPAAGTRKRGSVRMWIFVTIAILLVVGGGFAFRKSRAEGKATQVSFEAVQRRDVVQLVSATGRIQPETEVKISAEVSGEILELPVKEGQPVSRGDLLVRINPDIYLRQVEQQEASVKSAEARVLENRALSRQRELDARDAERLHRDGVRSEADLRASQAAFEAAAAGVLAAEADVLRAKAALNQARENLSKTTILAPMDGTVSVLNTEVGDRVVATGQFAGTEILRLADLKRMEVRVNVNENDVINVEVGDTSRISVDAYRRRQFTGIVREIATTAKTSGTGTQDEVTNFEVRIAIGNEDGALRPGMSASADIETKSVTAALTVPIQSVTVRTRDARKTPEEILKEREREDSRNKGEGAAQAVNAQEQRRREREDRESYERVVFIRDGSVVRLRPVETGIADTTHMEILSGVSEGEEVVAGPFSAINRTLKDGAEVRQAKPEGKSGASK